MSVWLLVAILLACGACGCSCGRQQESEPPWFGLILIALLIGVFTGIGFYCLLGLAVLLPVWVIARVVTAIDNPQRRARRQQAIWQEQNRAAQQAGRVGWYR